MPKGVEEIVIWTIIVKCTCVTHVVSAHMCHMSSKKQQDPKKTRNAAFYLYTCYSFNSYQTKRNCFDLFFFFYFKKLTFVYFG